MPSVEQESLDWLKEIQGALIEIGGTLDKILTVLDNVLFAVQQLPTA